MNKTEQVNKNDQLLNIRSLADFEINKFVPFISEYEKLHREVAELSDALNDKRSQINQKLEEQAAKEYEKALKEMAKADKKIEENNNELIFESTIPMEVNDTKIDKIIVEEPVIINEPIVVPKETEKLSVKDKEPVAAKEIVKEKEPIAVKEAVKDKETVKEEKPSDVILTKPSLDSIPELKMKSRPKPPKEEPEFTNKGRVYIPDNTTKPSGQPINRYTDGLPKSRKPAEGEVRSKTQFNRTAPTTSARPMGINNSNNTLGPSPRYFGNSPRPQIGGIAPRFNNARPTTGFKTNNLRTVEAPTFAPKENRVLVKKKTDKPAEEVKKVMDKRTLIRRGFIDNLSPGAVFDYDASDSRYLKARKPKKGEFTPQTLQIDKAIITTELVPIKILSEKIGKSGAQIIKQLFILGIVKTINESIDFETAELVANELGIELELNAIKSSEEKLADQFVNNDNVVVKLIPRPPVVTIMGHVDHGKTSLLDYIRKANVVSGEAGGITQHIGAYTTEINNQKITFLDTPGHEAFTSMRLRGAQVTDIVVIVVAADDGIMPQTIEAIAHAKASNVSIIVAINKMDKRTANPEKIKQQLTEHELVPEEWGGDIICVPVSAITGEGIDKLLETILLVAEVKELKADYEHYAKGVIIEAQLDKGKGPVATVLVQSGTLRVSDYIVAGTVIGKIRALVNDKGELIKVATPSMPVQIQGFNDVPQAGDTLFVVADERLARKVIDDRKDLQKSTQTVNKAGTSLEDVFNKIAEGEIKDLNLIVKGDVQGSVEAIKQELMKLSNAEAKVNIVQASVGAINESDVMLAESSHSIILGFNVRPDSKAKKMAERSLIDIKIYRIIYDIINDITLALKGMLAPKFKERIIGRAEVRMTFKVTGAGTIAGCYVIEDKIIRNAKVRLLRDNVIIYEGAISSLKRMKDDAREVAQGFECGIGIDGYNDIKEQDIIEAFISEEVKD